MVSDVATEVFSQMQGTLACPARSVGKVGYERHLVVGKGGGRMADLTQI